VEGERGRLAAQHGSVLMLVPAGVLVLVVLGSIAVDFAIVFLAQRELAGVAAASANDAAAAAISEQAFYRGDAGVGAGAIEIDDEAARRVVEAALDRAAPRGVRVTGLSVQAPGRQVCVTLDGEVEFLFAQALPGVAHSTAVRGRAMATAVEGPAGTRVQRRAVC
jgi:Flp pilus assembly protein TadG